MLNRPEEYTRMRDFEVRLWWYRCLHDLILRNVRENVPPGDTPILDAGCGTGGVMMKLRECGYSNVTGIDASEDAIGICRERNLNAEKADLRNLPARFQKESFGAAICTDAIYFLSGDEQVSFLQKLRDLLRPNGVVLLNVPALTLFRGTHDLAVGIQRRTTELELADLAARANFRRERSFYWPFFLSPLILLSRMIQRVRIRHFPPDRILSDIDVPPAPVNELLYAVTSFETRILTHAPFGSSVFAVLRKNGPL